ncbi:MAG: molybdopterin biosynthesis protein [Atribacterota bacterium]|nr:molybdopterin biosynthesis protein [Atribacterota bacterium]
MFMMERNIYLKKISLEEAKQKIEKAITEGLITLNSKHELLSVEKSLERITSKAVFARRSSLHYTASAMDGIAVHSRSAEDASEKNPIILSHKKDFLYVNTGDPLPEEFDSVIKIEDVVPVRTDSNVPNQKENFAQLKIFQSVSPGMNVRNIGEDIVTHQLILTANHKIRPVDIGALMAGGISEIEVWKKPQVAIIPTGEELVGLDEGEIKAGDILDFNSRMLSNSVIQWGGEPVIYPIIRDIKEDLKKILQSAVKDNDIVTVIAGTSAGSKDFTAKVLADMGEILFHGIAMMPGKPTLAGMVQGIPVIGLPGYPVSYLLAAWEFVLPLVYKSLRLSPPGRIKTKVLMAKKIVSKLGNEEFLRVKLAKIDDKIMAYPLNRGAGIISSLVEADALIRIPSLSEGLSFKEETEAELLLEHDFNIDNTIIIIGSHDLIFDILKNELQTNSPEFRLASFHTGSMGGLLALKQEIAHLATSHLLDVESGEYNFPYIKRVLISQSVAVVNMAFRQQGFMVAKGNPKNILAIKDLARDDIRYINRQKGSGTRILLDYLLKKNNINPTSIQGYNQEEFTHLMVASAVVNQRVDVGLGIFSAAKAFNLDFVPLIKERYDLIIPERYFHSQRIKKILEIIRTNHFKEQVAQLGGYDLNECGNILLNGKIN